MLLINITSKQILDSMMLLIEVFLTNGENMPKEEKVTKLGEKQLNNMLTNATALNF